MLTIKIFLNRDNTRKLYKSGQFGCDRNLTHLIRDPNSIFGWCLYFFFSIKLLIFSYPSFLTSILGAQKNRLIRRFFWVPQHMFWLRNTGLQIFFKIGGRKWPMEQKMVGHFLKWWAQAYQTKHSWHLGSILYLHTDTAAYIHMYIDCWWYSKTCLERPLKKEDQNCFSRPIIA